MQLKQNEWRLAYRAEQAFVARINRIRETTTPEQQPLVFSEHITYVVTGATGGLGLATATWLVEHGARDLLLLSRQPLTTQAQQAINALIQQGANISHRCVDIADRTSLEDVLLATQSKGARKLGIIHCAGVLDDHLLIDMQWSNFDHAYSAKVLGTLNLDELTRQLDIDCFVMFSSAASLLGNRGQANYAAANSFMDAIAHQRKRTGLPALSINWGPWASVGMAQSNSTIARQLSAQGFSALSTQLALQALGSCLLGTRTQVGVIDCQWDQYLHSTEQLQSFLSQVATVSISTQEQQRQDAQSAIVEQLAQASAVERLSLLTTIVHTQIRKILGLAESTAVPEDQALTDQGFDSLMAVQLTNAVGRMLGQRLPVSLVFNHPSPKALSLYLLDLLNSQLATPEQTATDGVAKPSHTSSSDRARSLLDDLDNLLEQS
jgi:NAD(P)-dependent dehydrogenase (short-subunit alcohol dehydrogenase family)/acyl carrier protein